jgi:hypothetical protein
MNNRKAIRWACAVIGIGLTLIFVACRGHVLPFFLTLGLTAVAIAVVLAMSVFDATLLAIAAGIFGLLARLLSWLSGARHNRGPSGENGNECDRMS